MERRIMKQLHLVPTPEVLAETRVLSDSNQDYQRQGNAKARRQNDRAYETLAVDLKPEIDPGHTE
jgi:hypothetical protein